MKKNTSKKKVPAKPVKKLAIKAKPAKKSSSTKTKPQIEALEKKVAILEDVVKELISQPGNWIVGEGRNWKHCVINHPYDLLSRSKYFMEPKVANSLDDITMCYNGNPGKVNYKLVVRQDIPVNSGTETPLPKMPCQICECGEPPHCWHYLVEARKDYLSGKCTPTIKGSKMPVTAA